MGSEYERLKKELDNLQTSYRTLNQTYLTLTRESDTLKEIYENQTRNYESLLQNYYDLQVAASRIALDLRLAMNMIYVLAATIVTLSGISIYLGTRNRKQQKKNWEQHSSAT